MMKKDCLGLNRDASHMELNNLRRYLDNEGLELFPALNKHFNQLELFDLCCKR